MNRGKVNGIQNKILILVVRNSAQGSWVHIFNPPVLTKITT